MRLLETFENAQWREVKQMCPMRHCRPFENLFECTQWKKKQTNSNSVILYLIRQQIWVDIWKHTVENSQTNWCDYTFTSSCAYNLRNKFIWEHKLEKLNRATCELGYSFSTVHSGENRVIATTNINIICLFLSHKLNHCWWAEI